MVIALMSAFATNAQVLNFRSTDYSQRSMGTYGWTSWSSWQKCNVSITINLNNDQVIIYSNRTQYYQIYDYPGA